MRLPLDAPIPLLAGVHLLAWCARVNRWGFARLWVVDALAELVAGGPLPDTHHGLVERVGAAAAANGRDDLAVSHVAWLIGTDRSLLELPIPDDWQTCGDQLVDVLAACWVVWVEDQLYDLADVCGWWPERTGF